MTDIWWHGCCCGQHDAFIHNVKDFGEAYIDQLKSNNDNLPIYPNPSKWIPNNNACNLAVGEINEIHEEHTASWNYIGYVIEVGGFVRSQTT